MQAREPGIAARRPPEKMLEQIQHVREQAEAELQQVQSSDDLEQWRIRYLSRKGEVQDLLKGLGALSADVRPQAGQQANKLKKDLTAALNARKGELAGGASTDAAPGMDVTLPGQSRPLGSEHLIQQTIAELCEIFGRMGFDIADGPEVEDEFHNFEALNIPPAHPARDPLDNFYLDPKRLLRSQTSTVQIRVMESTPPPVRVIAPGRVYRPDTVDATHSFMFHQVEGLYVDSDVSMVDLKSCLNQFVHAFYGPDVRTRFRPSFFPFTEPSAELDISWFGEGGEENWVELGGCGMVDPNVFEAVGYDPEQVTGFAFGMGIERILMRKFHIPDIRLLYEGDVRFLRQW